VGRFQRPALGGTIGFGGTIGLGGCTGVGGKMHEHGLGAWISYFYKGRCFNPLAALATAYWAGLDPER
jgi:hypothetical protein